METKLPNNFIIARISAEDKAIIDEKLQLWEMVELLKRYRQ